MDLGALYQAAGLPVPEDEPETIQAPNKPGAEIEQVESVEIPRTPPACPWEEAEPPTPADDMGELPPWLEAREERAAILEHESGFSREEAEAEAARLYPGPEPHAGADDGERFHGFTRVALLALAGPSERVALEGDPDILEAFAFALRLGEIRARGERPDHYTRAAYCKSCGPVWLFPGEATRVLGCPWCENRAKGRPIPRPMVVCSDCQHWRADRINPSGGLGSCATEAEASKRPGSLRPGAEIYCGAWRPKTEGLER